VSDSPSTSLVKLTSAQVIEMAGTTIARVDRARAHQRAELESRVDAFVASRAASRWRWLRGVPSKAEAADWLNLAWDLQLVEFRHAKRREVATQLLRAAHLADDVWVSVSDLAQVYP